MANKDQENIPVADIRGLEMNVGDFVRYINTGTVGHILEIMTDDEGTWAFLDSTELYYKIEFLEITPETKAAIDKRKDLEEDIQEKISRREEIAGSATTENVEMGGAG
ncbi:DUF2098 domain-containing protein [Methanolapillus ohkumae]|uniref:DUF2098 domain-containing protein n=1 Tax=Methanolapillus ohkumae TaxID=3028298 RepID=A0AA97A6X1_9EURY|nr:hypothetical protein MsAm2_15190 [Methanosarcinaceae archaeon Am2]